MKDSPEFHMVILDFIEDLMWKTVQSPRFDALDV
jgi:hypothetical protein